MEKLWQILNTDNSKFKAEVKKRWEDFCSTIWFYGVWKKVLNLLSLMHFVAVSTDISMNKFVYVINADENRIVQDEAVNQI